MGNKVCRHNRVILTSDIALHFKSSNLVRDVLPIIERWQQEGSDMCLTIPSFKETFDVVSDASAEQQFGVFDTQGTGKVDACQVLMVYIFLSQGDLGRKVDAVFSTFGFEGSQGAQGSISFDEAIIMLTACIQGTQKVCQTDFEIPDNEIAYHCKSLFDLHRLSYDKRIGRSQFDEWVWDDPSPRSFIQMFHEAQGLPDILAQVKIVNQEQGHVFQMLANGQFHVTPRDLQTSRDFVATLRDASQRELNTLIQLMLLESSDHVAGLIHVDAFHTVLRPWNIFNECDLDGDHNLDEKEVEILLWIQLRQRPTEKQQEEFTRFIDLDDDGGISREEWVQKIIELQQKRAASRLALRSPSKSEQGDLRSPSKSDRSPAYSPERLVLAA
jgi:Ca2+-binding EF-hand superfamily protein